MTGHRVSFQTTDGQSFHENVRKELLNCYHISVYKILLSKRTPFYTHELSHIMSENVSKYQFNEYENHSSQKQKTLMILFIVGRYNHNWYIFNKNPFLFNFQLRQVNCNKLF